jgi:hypothetical protein
MLPVTETCIKIPFQLQRRELPVIPAEAGIHFSQNFEWTPASAGVTTLLRIDYFETGSQYFTR